MEEPLVQQGIVEAMTPTDWEKVEKTASKYNISLFLFQPEITNLSARFISRILQLKDKFNGKIAWIISPPDLETLRLCGLDRLIILGNDEKEVLRNLSS